jgi:hypothetical protein
MLYQDPVTVDASIVSASVVALDKNTGREI